MITIDLADGDRLVLHGLNAPPGERGAVERVTRSGRVWIARPPDTGAQDAFVALRLEDGAVRVESFQGLTVRLELETGALLGQAFVK